MKPTFLNCEKPLVTVMLKQVTPDGVIKEMEQALQEGAEAFGLQTENFKRMYHKPEIWKEIFAAAKGKPLYVTNYKLVENAELSYEELAEELLTYPDYGATLCDVMGDMFCKHPEELTDNEEAVKKQMYLIDKLHEKGAEVIMSSHVNQFMTAEHVLEMAFEHKRRGADISKIVAHANDMEQQIENLRITDLLKRELGIPFLFLSGGECRIHRRIGILLGCCMSLCVCEQSANPDNPQPLIREQRIIRDEMHFVQEI